MAITRKKKECVCCKKTTYIFSKGRCEYCTKLQSKPLTSNYTFKRSTLKPSYKKHTDKNKAKREGLGEFFEKYTEKSKGRSCQECGCRLQGGTTTEIAHILSKSSYPEICTHEKNFLYLCLSCHNKFDSASYKDMKVLEIVRTNLKVLVPIVGYYGKEIEKFLTFKEYEKLT